MNNISNNAKYLRKPPWIRVKIPTNASTNKTTQLIKKYNLNTICKEAACPNCSECFKRGTASFIILGNTCTRNCAFCNVSGGTPETIDHDEPTNLAQAVKEMNLSHVVITSVTRDDLADGGAEQFLHCIQEIRKRTNTTIEILTPDFQNCRELALDILSSSLPNVFNHNLETVPQLYSSVRPQAIYQESLALIANFKNKFPHILTKSGLMLGLGESLDQVVNVLEDLAKNGCDMITLGQYLQPSTKHYPVKKYVTPEEFHKLQDIGQQLGFKHVASAPMIRSSYLADQHVIMANCANKTIDNDIEKIRK